MIPYLTHSELNILKSTLDISRIVKHSRNGDQTLAHQNSNKNIAETVGYCRYEPNKVNHCQLIIMFQVA